MKTLIIMLTLLSTLAFGKEGGNGGGIHHCPGRTHQEFYDLYEAYTRFDLRVIPEGLTVKQYIDRAVMIIRGFEKSYKTDRPDNIRKYLDHILKQGYLKFRTNIDLNKIGDANIFMTNVGCTYEQIANWDDMSGNLIVRKEYFDSLTPLHRAALFVHEAIYKELRETYVLNNSDEVRYLVGIIFSTRPELPKNMCWFGNNVDCVIEPPHQRK